MQKVNKVVAWIILTKNKLIENFSVSVNLKSLGPLRSWKLGDGLSVDENAKALTGIRQVLCMLSY